MHALAVFVLVVLPWLNPFTFGPSPGVVPLLFSWACAAGLMVAMGLTTDPDRKSRLVAAVAVAWLVAALLSALMGLLQYFGATAVFGPWVNTAGVGEAYANLRQRNQFATLTNIGLAALLWWVARAPSKPLTWRPVAAVVAAVLLSVGNAASSSRTGMVQLVVLVAVGLVWGGWRQPAIRRVLLTAAVAYSVAAVALPALSGFDLKATGVLARLHEGDSLCSSRLTLWGNVLHLIALKPWLGWGWGELDYAHFITLYSGPRFCDILDNAHNLPLQLAVELGIPVALAVCGGGLWLAWRAKPWREANATRQMAWLVLAMILLHSLLEYPLWYGPFQIAFGLGVWLLWPASALRTQKFIRIRPVAPVLCAGVAIVLIAFSGYAAWDYHRISQVYISPAHRSVPYRENTMAKLQASWLFRDQVQFAELTTTELTTDNAAHLNALAKALLHFSPEPRVVDKLIESATLLGRKDEALFYLQRYRAAFR